MNKIISVTDLKKNYGKFEAVKGISFDVYEGENLPEGKKSYAVSFILQDEKKTLTDQQIEKIMKRLQAAFESDLGAELR